MTEWLVTFRCEGGGHETVLRTGPDEASVSYPDDLDCPVESVRPLAGAVLSAAWTKGDALRVEVAE